MLQRVDLTRISILGNGYSILFFSHHLIPRTDALASKGILLARVDVNGTIYNIIATHLQAGNNPKDVKARQGQVVQVGEFVKKWTSADSKVCFSSFCILHEVQGYCSITFTKCIYNIGYLRR